MNRVNSGRGGGGFAAWLNVLILVVVAMTLADAVRYDSRLVKRDLNGQSKDDSGKMKKLYSNKEIVAFDDDEDQPSVAGAAAAAAPVIAESPSMSSGKEQPSLLRSQRTDTHVYQSSNNKAARLRANDDNDDETISDDMIDSLLAELSASAVNKRRLGNNGRVNNGVYRKKPAYEIIWDYFDEQQPKGVVQDSEEEEDNGDDLVELESEDEMKANEVGASLEDRRKLMASILKNMDETGDMFGGAGNHRQPFDVKTDDEEPVTNNVEVKEKLMLENEYNKELKDNAPHKHEKSDQIYTSQILSMDVLNNQPNPANDQHPSMIKQNGALAHEVDPNLSSQINSLKQQNDHLFMFVLAGCILAGVVALVAAGVCWYTVHRSHKASEAEYGVKIGKFNSSKTGSVKSTSSSSGDRRLAQSAQMYHYQHQKQQMIAMEKANNDMKPDNSDNSEGEAEEGDYTVYECPGLAPTGEMVVKNPLFKEDFSQSLNNINSTAAATAGVVTAASNAATTSPPPPAYSTLTPIGESSSSQQQLIQLGDSTTETPAVAAAAAAAASTTVQETTRVESINEITNNNTITESRSNNASSNNLAANQQQ